MNKIDSFIAKIFLFGLPVIIIAALFCGSINADKIDEYPQFIQVVNSLSGGLIIIWILSAAYLSVRLLLSSSYRSTVLAKITFMKERDEREAMYAGKAAKVVFLSTLSILICALCFSVFTVSVHKLPIEKAVNGKTKSITIGFKMNLLDNNQKDSFENSTQTICNFDYKGIPFSRESMILFLILWQIGVYNFSIWSFHKEEDQE